MPPRNFVPGKLITGRLAVSLLALILFLGTVETAWAAKNIVYASATTMLNTAFSGDQVNPSIAPLPDDKFVVVWSDRAAKDGSKGGIFGRIYTSGFVPVSPDLMVNTITNEFQTKQSVASAPNGHFMVVWHGGFSNVKGQVFDAEGVKIGSELPVNRQRFNGNSDIAADVEGNFWVVSGDGTGYFSKYSNAGELLIDSQIFHAIDNPYNPKIAGLTDGRMLVSWYDGANSDSDIYGQIVNADGTLSGDVVRLNSTTAGSQKEPFIAGLKSGGFVAVWQSSKPSGDLNDVYARVFDVSGVGGAEFTVNTDIIGDQTFPSVRARSDGGFIIGWRSTAAPAHVYLQAYAADGSPEGANEAVSDTVEFSAVSTQSIDFIELTSGSFVAAWSGFKGSLDIFGRSFLLSDLSSPTDFDQDGARDELDNCPLNANADQLDSDGDGLGDICDVDDDNDGVTDADELALGTNPFGSDTDGDEAGDSADNCPLLANADQADSDGDGIGDVCDLSVSPRVFFSSGTTVLNITDPTGGKINPRMAAMPNDKFVFVWSDRAGRDGSAGGIYGRIYTSGFEPVSSDFLVNTLTSGFQSKQSVASAPNGHFMVVWHGSSASVKGQVFDADGIKIGSELPVNPQRFSGNSDIIADAEGDFWVVSGDREGGHFSKYSNAGELLINSQIFHDASNPYDPKITALADGRMLVSWFDGGDPEGSDIFGQLISADGALLGDVLLLNSTVAESQRTLAISGLTSGGFVAAWQSYLLDGSLYGIYARVFDASGVGGTEFRVNTQGFENQVLPDVIARSDGGFVIGWTDAAPPQHVYLQAYASDGSPEGINEVISRDPDFSVSSSSEIELVELTSGRFVAAWTAFKGTVDIFARSFVLSDNDGDNIINDSDNCRLIANAGQVDLDGDGVGDACDSDDDGDGVSDVNDAFPNNAAETSDSDGDGIGNNADDDDSDGLIGALDNCPNLANAQQLDLDADGVGDVCDSDRDGDGVPNDIDDFADNALEQRDLDSDSVGDNEDLDDDGDGVEDSEDGAPTDASIQYDLDQDGIDDAFDTNDDSNVVADKDDTDFVVGDSLATAKVGFQDTLFPGMQVRLGLPVSFSLGQINPTQDNVAVISVYLPTETLIVKDPEFCVSEKDQNYTSVLCIIPIGTLFGDGKFGYFEIPVVLPPKTKDFVYISMDVFLDDSLSEQLPDFSLNNKSITLAYEIVNRFTIDFDEDQASDLQDNCPFVANSNQLDSDSDGFGDACDFDLNNNFVPNDLEVVTDAEPIDRDLDGISNDADNCPDVANTIQKDTDFDGQGDSCDSDDDNDQVEDAADQFPLNPTESVDTDSDGTGNNADTDDDNDGVLDGSDAFPLDPTETLDTDADGVGDNADAFPSDAEESMDTDGDQVGDNADNCPSLSNPNQLNTDGDREGNVCDRDDDNDGFTDEQEAIDGTNPLSQFSCQSGCFSFDVDENNEAQALTDGLLVIRHLFGFGGDSLGAGAIGGEADRATSGAISSYLADANAELDVDGDGESKALTDGLLLIRYLFGFTGDSLISGAIGNGAERDTAEEVEAYIEARLPLSP